MNEYHKKFQELQEQNTFRGQQWFGKRQELVNQYAWAVPNEDVLQYLAEFDELIEVGAGSGYWAYCIEKYGGYVDAYDINPPDETWFDVTETAVQHSFEYVKNKPVLLVWPPLDDQMASNVLRFEPSHVCYVGEPRGGCTADNEFFDIIDKQYGLVAKIELPSYVGVDDDFYHYVRKL